MRSKCSFASCHLFPRRNKLSAPTRVKAAFDVSKEYSGQNERLAQKKKNEVVLVR